MKIPNNLTIGGHKIKVIIKEIDECGQLRRDKNEIWISNKIEVSQQEATLFHEIIHQLNSQLNETMVDALAEQLYAVLKDNKMLK